MKENLREKINRDNGEHFQVGNHDLNAREITGYALIVIAMLIYLITDKADFQYGWLGWLSLATGMLFVFLGIRKNERSSST